METLHVQRFEKEGLPFKLTSYKIAPGNYGYAIQRNYLKQGKVEHVSYFMEGMALKETLDKKLKETIRLIKKKGFVEVNE